MPWRCCVTRITDAVVPSLVLPRDLLDLVARPVVEHQQREVAVGLRENGIGRFAQMRGVVVQRHAEHGAAWARSVMARSNQPLDARLQPRGGPLASADAAPQLLPSFLLRRTFPRDVSRMIRGFAFTLLRLAIAPRAPRALPVSPVALHVRCLRAATSIASISSHLPTAVWTHRRGCQRSAATASRRLLQLLSAAFRFAPAASTASTNLGVAGTSSPWAGRTRS